MIKIKKFVKKTINFLPLLRKVRFTPMEKAVSLEIEEK